MVTVHRFWPALVLVTLAVALSSVRVSVALAQEPIWRPYFELEGRTGGLSELGQGRMFLPLWQDCNRLLFADLRGLWTDGQSAEGNWGLAYRTIWANDWIAGTYGFFDARNSQFNNHFYQTTIGVELLNVNCGFRANCYIPSARVKNADLFNRAFLQDDNLVVRQGIEVAYWGVDFEAERLIWYQQVKGCEYPSWWSPGGLDAEIWGSAGVFHFQNDLPSIENITGPRARVEFRWYDFPLAGPDSRLVVSAQHEYDNVRGSVGTGMLSVRIPFGPGGARRGMRLSPLERRMVTPIVRDVDIVTAAGALGRAEPATLAQTGQVVSRARLIDADDDIVAEMAGVGTNGMLMVDGGAGPLNIANTVVVQNGQMLIGGGTQLAVVGARTGTPAWFTVPGARPTVNGVSAAHDVFTINDHSMIRGFDISGGKNGIGGNSVSGFLIADNNIRDAARSGLQLDGVNDGTISGNTASGNMRYGFATGTFSGGTISGNTATGNTVDGFYANTFSGGTMSGNTASGNLDDGYHIGNNGGYMSGGALIDNVATDNGGAGYEILRLNGQGTAIGNVGSGNATNNEYP